MSFHNRKRPHTTLNYRTPEEYENAFLQQHRSEQFGEQGSDL
jgi:transposase InsO family protein